jgi:hypothetical protein
MPLTGEAEADRRKARWEIIQVANRHKMNRPLGLAGGTYIPKLYGMKQLQRAVFHVRQFKLVKPEVLERAGFRVKTK